MSDSVIPAERITQAILLIREEKVMLDEDLATLYEVPTKRLNEQVKRNQGRFPSDFMLQLTEEEWTNLKSQFATSRSWGGRRTPPYAFTENGVAMLSSVLSSERAIQVNIVFMRHLLCRTLRACLRQVALRSCSVLMRAFTTLRRLLASHQVLAKKLDELERKYDAQFRSVFEAIRQLMEPPLSKRKPIGFRKGE